MHRMSPGVERAVVAAREWAERLESDGVRLAHFVLALLDEEEGRPAVLAERAGLSVPAFRSALVAWRDSPRAPGEVELFNAARNWSLARRRDPEFLTDVFLLTVLRADAHFESEIDRIGLNSFQLETMLTEGSADTDEGHEWEGRQGLAVFTQPDSRAEIAAGRVMDVNFNRAREAARVWEDYCRFVLDDKYLTEQIKALRHDLAEIANRLPKALLLSARDTEGDIGTAVSAAGEYERGSLRDVAIANGKRFQESLRSLEEFGKLFASTLGRDLEALRYRAYTLEKALHIGAASRDRLSNAKLYVLLSGSQASASLDWTIERAAAGGVDIVQLREKSLEDGALLARARDLRRWTKKAGVLFIVNDRPDIARLAEADGVHLGQDDMSIEDARRILGPDALIGRSTHSLEQVRSAVLQGADYLGIGPVFPSSTKAFESFPGLDFIQRASAETSLPAFALGGIGPDNVGRVVAAGAKRIAVGAAISSSEDPERIALALKAALAPI